MNPPKPYAKKKDQGYSRCFACGRWRFNVVFFHDGQHFVLCRTDYEDYWENTDELCSDYRSW